MRLIQVESSLECENNAITTSGIQNKGNQVDGDIPPPPVIIPSTMVNEVEGADSIATTKFSSQR